VKGEVLGLQVIVHNYLETPVEAQVTLDNDEGFFKFLEDEQANKLSKNVKINASAVTSVTFSISAVKFGQMNLKVKAVSDSASDAVTRTLLVKPPGVKHTQNNAVLINLLEVDSAEQKVSASFPEDRVPDADSLKISVIGDILGGTMNNLDKLIRLPSGCGKQNMLHFVPDIVMSFSTI
jgi:CD109 antigen